MAVVIAVCAPTSIGTSGAQRNGRHEGRGKGTTHAGYPPCLGAALEDVDRPYNDDVATVLQRDCTPLLEHPKVPGKVLCGLPVDPRCERPAPQLQGDPSRSRHGVSGAR